MVDHTINNSITAVLGLRRFWPCAVLALRRFGLRRFGRAVSVAPFWPAPFRACPI
uniref:Uncharacterized protein n=1 Tax=Meloidogyne enterolobii TaxID=390850 RepID=A0A6V7X992_MELEN|nr:unnamed protein product [Meloidogyne enterolobii]